MNQKIINALSAIALLSMPAGLALAFNAEGGANPPGESPQTGAAQLQNMPRPEPRFYN